jgi:hypothetical protein
MGRKTLYLWYDYSIDIKDNKIWIQRNNTEINLAESLVKRGIDKNNIVIGLHSPFMRQFSGYAIN